MKTLFFLCILVMPVMACAPKLQGVVFDESGNASIATTMKKVATNDQYHGTLRAATVTTNNMLYLDLDLEVSVAFRRFYIEQGEYVSVQLSDNSFINLSNNQRVRSHPEMVLGNPSQVVQVFCPLTDSDIQRIMAHDITKISIVTLNKQGFEFEIQAGESKVIQQMISLITTPAK
jgi:hypothetical protein